MLNRLIPISSLLSGMERGDFKEFHDATGMSSAQYDRSIKHALDPISHEEAHSYQVAINLANLSDAQVMIDGQHVNPQRAGKPAEQCTQAAMLMCRERAASFSINGT